MELVTRTNADLLSNLQPVHYACAALALVTGGFIYFVVKAFALASKSDELLQERTHLAYENGYKDGGEQAIINPTAEQLTLIKSKRRGGFL